MLSKLRYLLTIIPLFIGASNALSQRNFFSFLGPKENYEFGLSLGAALYQGDLSYNLITPSLAKFQWGLLVKRNLSEKVSFRFGHNWGKLVGDDRIAGDKYNVYAAHAGNGAWDPVQLSYYERRKRNLNFYSKIREWNAMLEINFWNPPSWREGSAIVPYLVAGVGYFSFNPKTIDRNGQEVALVNYQTELYKYYKLKQFSIPMGIGLKFVPSNSIYVSLEAVWRKTFTDWIDDVSHNYAGEPAKNDVYLQQLSDRSGEVSPRYGNLWDKTSLNPRKYIRGNPNDKDSYIFASLTITKTFKGYRTCTNF
jgi:hypothetical protein